MEKDKVNSEEFHTLSKKNKKLVFVLGLVFVFIIIPVFSLKYYKFALNRPAQNFKEKTFTISEGETVTVVAERLAEKKLINSEFLFKAYLVSEGLHKKIEAGVYKIPAGLSVKDLAQIFQHGTNDIQITLIEGWRVEQHAIKLSESFSDIEYDDFIKLAKSHEGYLFPDTYFFNAEVSEDEVVDALTSTFNQKTQKFITSEVLQDMGLTKDQLVIFASIVEREVSKPEDREIVAGILINRWKNGMALEADATTQYAVALERFCLNKDEKCPSEDEAEFVDWWPNNLTEEELDNDSAYNTRKNAGLSPKPISNPSLDSIKAVLNYKDTSYNFYLTDENGTTHFSNTLEEHNRNIVQYLN